MPTRRLAKIAIPLLLMLAFDLLVQPPPPGNPELSATNLQATGAYAQANFALPTRSFMDLLLLGHR